MIAFLVGVLALGPQVYTNADVLDEEEKPQVVKKHVTVLRSDGGGEGEMQVKVIAGDDAEAIAINEDGIQQIIKVELADQNMPKVYMGVRLTAIPGPLAAHLGEGGVMVGNVVAGSPADEAGLEPYDIIVGYGEAEILTNDDLFAMLHETEPGQMVDLRVLRGGEEQALQIAPAERTDDVAWDWKFEEPDRSLLLDDALELRGRALMLDDEGRWIMKDLGELQHLPDLLEDLELDFDFDFDVDEDGLSHLYLHGLHAGDPMAKDAKVTMSITIQDDDGTLSLSIDPDKQVEVRRTDADGNETADVYESVEALEESDPEAYEIYQRHAEPTHMRFFHARPHGLDADKLRKEFQIDVQKRLTEAMERAGAARALAHERALEAYAQAMRHREEALSQAEAQGWASKGGVQGNGEAATEQRKIGRFKALDFKTIGRVEITMGQPTPLEITGDANLLPLIETRVRGGKLVVMSEKSLSPKVPVVIRMTTPELEDIRHGGAGNIVVKGIDSKKLNVALSGAGGVELAGKTERLSVRLMGAGDVNAEQLQAREADVRVSGVGNARVHALKQLKAVVTGVGDILYSGDPKVTKKLSGVGSLKKIK
jgi:hypothetical protein